MSTDTHSPSVAGFRCEAVTTDTVASPCLRSKSANLSHIQSADLRHGSSDRDDPAVLIGLALAFVRQGPLLGGVVPEPLMLRLRATADSGNAACRLLLDWLRNRNRDLVPFGNEHLSLSAATGLASVTPPSDPLPPRRSPRERVLTRVSQPGVTDGRRRGRTCPRDPVQDAYTAIIAAQTGGRTDG
ncbi:hypothetical protein [Agrobacterium pusense]|uniref:hypothetical protein n=1 Tax=Agrobacterium pusense TaxID=648995 RepID=UPI000458BA0D|nr:hypothetical protein [Agrobacterium pusense]AMD57578.1 hypothetical protein AWN88_04910 [Agrobacterium tumefaciens]KAJ33038.1 hypothetical protein BW45_14730 [Agrobacterium tumefaciens]MCJ2874364.1 hypothetical protein [Agrobacterium pusense]MCZ7930667.1 hypothetical protein [Agrobacterium pusense]WFN88722.1 hypothetical protein P9K39_20145 [Agrobacterium pusense]